MELILKKHTWVDVVVVGFNIKILEFGEVDADVVHVAHRRQDVSTIRCASVEQSKLQILRFVLPPLHQILHINMNSSRIIPKIFQ